MWLLAGPIKLNWPSVTLWSVFQYPVTYTYIDVLQLILNQRTLRINNDSRKIELKDLKTNISDEIIDHCAGLLLIKPLCTVDVWQHLEDQGRRFSVFDNVL